MALYDVYFKPTFPMIACIEAESEEEAERMVKEDDGTLFTTEDLVNKFLSSLEWNEYFAVDRVEKVDE